MLPAQAFFQTAPLQSLDLPKGRVHVQRDDLLHPVVSGNKWRKLSGWLQRARLEKKSILLTYGGAFSNHLLATACLAQHCGLRSMGILRGDEPMDNPWLQAARGFGMQLCQVSRATYRDKALALAEIQSRAGMAGLAWQEVLVIPEGGGGPEGFVGFQELIDGWRAQSFFPGAVLHASATATTAVGLALALARAGMETQVLAVPVLHNLPEQQAVAGAYGVAPRLRWITGYGAGGYARSTLELRAFCQNFTRHYRLPCEPIYTGKALHALCHLLDSAQLRTEGLVFLHTGGLPDLHQA